MSAYSKEFKASAVAKAARYDGPISDVARDLGINRWTLREWVRMDPVASKRIRQHRRKPAPTDAHALVPAVGDGDGAELARLREENRRLLRENSELREDREILKKAAAFFVKESE